MNCIHKKNFYNLKAFLFLFKAEPALFISILFHCLTKGIFPFVGIYFSARIINALEQIIDNKNEALLHHITILIIAVIIITAVVMVFEALCRRWAEYKKAGLWNFKNDRHYTKKFLEMDFRNIDDPHTYELYSKIRQNASWSDWGFGRVIEAFENLCHSFITIAASAALSISLFTFQVQTESLRFLNSPVFIILIIVFLFLLIIIPAKLETKKEQYWAACSEEATEGNRIFSFFFRLFEEKERAPDVRIYNQQNEGKKIVALNTIFTPHGKLAGYARGVMGFYAFLSRFLSASLMLIIYGFVALKAAGGAFLLGNIAQYVASITAFSAGIGTAFEVFGKMKNNREFLKTSFEFLNIKNTIKNGSAHIDPNGKNIIQFKNVSFKYSGNDDYVLKNINVTLKQNSRIAVVGKNGSGKTTFIKLLCRLYDTDEGEILLNGKNIKEYEYTEYLALFSVVFQDFKLTAFTLAENVAASKNYDEKKVLQCLTKSDFSIEKNKFVHGVNTNLYSYFDKNGVNISGGEEQKIAIARSLYKDAPFLILDEPTAALDPIAEQEIYSKFNKIVENKTAVYISHRLSSCRFCDEIVVFDSGQIVQHGTHENLMHEETGLYKKLYEAQAQYYKTAE